MGLDQDNAGLLPASARPRPRIAPLWHVVLIDDNDHTYDYVIEMLGRLFRMDREKAYRLACEVDANGRAIVATSHFERSEFKCNQILAYGADWRLERSTTSMNAELEPVES